MTLAQNSGMARVMRDTAVDNGARGFIGDPLKLPFARILQEAQSIRVSDAFARMVCCGACALTMGQQEELYLRTIKGLDKKNLDIICRAFTQLVEDMQARDFTDLLGPVYMEIAHNIDKQRGGEYFTPHALTQLLARMSADEALFPEDRPLEGNEPTCGTGGMVLAFAERLVQKGISPLHSRWTLMDINATSCYGAFINTTLWGIPAEVICGNTLTLEVNWRWRNLLWHQARPLPRLEQPVADEESPLVKLATLLQSLMQKPMPIATAPPAQLDTAPQPTVQPSLFD